MGTFYFGAPYHCSEGAYEGQALQFAYEHMALIDDSGGPSGISDCQGYRSGGSPRGRATSRPHCTQRHVSAPLLTTNCGVPLSGSRYNTQQRGLDGRERIRTRSIQRVRSTAGF